MFSVFFINWDQGVTHFFSKSLTMQDMVVVTIGLDNVNVAWKPTTFKFLKTPGCKIMEWP